MNVIKAIKKTFNKVYKSPYYYVSPCPSCGSLVTGRYIRSHRDVTSNWQINESLRHGEIVKPSLVHRDENAFCLDCGAEWKEYISLKFITRDELKKERLNRMTEEILQERIKILSENEPTSGGIFNIRKFIGKI